MVLKCLARNDKASKGTENTSQTQALHTTTTKLQVLPAHLQYRISLSHCYYYYYYYYYYYCYHDPLFICDDYLYDHFLCHSLIGWNNSDHSLPGFVKLLPCGQLAADQMKHHVHPAWSCGFDRLGPVANRLMWSQTFVSLKFSLLEFCKSKPKSPKRLNRQPGSSIPSARPMQPSRSTPAHDEDTWRLYVEGLCGSLVPLPEVLTLCASFLPRGLNGKDQGLQWHLDALHLCLPLSCLAVMGLTMFSEWRNWSISRGTT